MKSSHNIIRFTITRVLRVDDGNRQITTFDMIAQETSKLFTGISFGMNNMITYRTTSKVVLVAFSLCVCKVVALVHV